MAAAFTRRSLASALLALTLLGAGGCSSLKFWDKNDGDQVIEGSPEQLYREAIQDRVPSSATRCSRPATRSASRPNRASWT